MSNVKMAKPQDPLKLLRAMERAYTGKLIQLDELQGRVLELEMENMELKAKLRKYEAQEACKKEAGLERENVELRAKFKAATDALCSLQQKEHECSK